MNPFVRQSFVAALVLSGALAACAMDPVHSSAVNALGGEIGGVPQGEYHRAGQPCVTCHSSAGPSKKTFTIAGTVYYGPTKAIGVDQVQVIMVDSLNSAFTTYTNCVGNFFVTPEQWQPSFPVIVEISKNGTTRQMSSHIGREPS
jgi:hypothetical protein